MASTDRLIQNLFLCYERQLRAQKLPLKDLKAIDAIVQCRREEGGFSVYECEQENTLTRVAHSCRHRSCAVCAARRRRDWIESQKTRLLDCKHFHCVFTLPHEYLDLWRYNRKWFTATFFSVVSATLLEMIGERHGVTPGILMAKHSWGRQLSLHPHVHCVISGGGLTKKGEWKETGEFLLPIRQLKARYRRRFQQAIEAAYAEGELIVPSDQDRGAFRRLQRQTWTKAWSVRIEPRYAHGKGVLLYLARYLRGGPIDPRQIVRCDDEAIEFRYKDHRSGRTRLLRLKPAEFIRRVLEHVPESGQHTVRHYGLYAGAARKKRERCRAQIGGLIEAHGEVERKGETGSALVCRRCGAKLRLVSTHRRERGPKANSYRVEYPATIVQQADGPVSAAAKKTSSRLRL